MNNCAEKFVNLWSEGVNVITSKSVRVDISQLKYLPKQTKKSYSKISGLRSMQAITGFEREIIEAYKAEISHDVWGNEKKMIIWARNKFNELKNKNYISSRLSSNIVENERDFIVKSWAELIDNALNTKKSIFLKLKILKSIVSDLKDNNSQLPPTINKNVFQKAINTINKHGFSFKKTYNRLFLDFVSVPGLKIEDASINNISGKWYSLKVPDYANSNKDPARTRKIKDFLTVLSQGSNWCTRNHKSIGNIFLGNDFHIFIDKTGCPQICIVGTDKHGGVFKYIVGNNQYAAIPEKYKPILKSFLEKNNLDNAVMGKTDNTLRPVKDMFF